MGSYQETPDRRTIFRVWVFIFGVLGGTLLMMNLPRGAGIFTFLWDADSSADEPRDHRAEAWGIVIAYYVAAALCVRAFLRVAAARSPRTMLLRIAALAGLFILSAYVLLSMLLGGFASYGP